MVEQKYIDGILTIHPKLFKRIRKAGTKTGSKVFGGWKQGSDIDFIMPPDFELTFDEAMQTNICCYTNNEGYRTNEFLSGYLKTESGIILNLLWMRSEEAYRIWVEATAMLKDCIEKYPILAQNMEDKKRRVQFFEAIKGMLA